MNKRIFTSIDLTHKIKQDISSLQNKGIYWIKWSPPENFHITLNFLGDLNDDEIAVVKQVMASGRSERRRSWGSMPALSGFFRI